MSKVQPVLVSVCVLLCYAYPGAVAGSGSGVARNTGAAGDVVPGIVIVKFKEGSSPSAGASLQKPGTISADMTAAGVTALEKVFPSIPALQASHASLARVYYARCSPSADTRRVAGALAATGLYEYAEPKYYQHVHEDPSDPDYPTRQQTYFNLLHASEGWSIAKGSSSVIIADVDGGTFWPHEDLKPNLWVNPSEDANHNGTFEAFASSAGGDLDGIDNDGDGRVDDVIGWNFTTNSYDPQGVASAPGNAAHGTATASHFGARTSNGLGMAGTSWNCLLMPICASSTAENNIEFGYEGIQFAYAHGASVINCSWGHAGEFSNFEQDVVNAATQAGALIVCSAGNDNAWADLAPEYPANYENVLAVGATSSSSDTRATFTNYGVSIPVYAPGISIWSALPSGGYASGGSGTSFSSPLVAGLAGLLKSLHPAWTPGQIAAQIRVTADSLDDLNPTVSGRIGHGRANFARALSELHPGIAIVSSSARPRPGKILFLTGDTIIVSFTVRNVLPTTATDISFVMESTDPAVQPLQAAASLPALAMNEEATLPDMMFVVGSLAAYHDVSLKLAWVSNGNNRDAYAIRVTVYPHIPEWATQIDPTSTSLYSVRAVSPEVAWAAGGSGTATAPVVLRTIDDGASWTDATGNLTGIDAFCIFAVDALTAWIGTGDGRIYSTNDGGVGWSLRPYPGTQSPFIDGIWFVDPLRGYALGDPPGGGDTRFMLLSTTDGGLTWAHVPNEPVGGSTEAGWNNSFWWTDAEHGWFGTNANKIWRTTDGGVSWSSAASGSDHSIGISFGTPLMGVAVHDDGKVARSTDGGASWQMVTSPTSADWRAVAFAPGTSWVWAVDRNAPFRSTDGGASWSAQAAFPSIGAFQHISIPDTGNGWTVTSAGEVFHYTPGGTVLDVAEHNEIVPTRFSLGQNYPNPFNPSTTIDAIVPETGHWTLSVYDVLGRHVATLWDGLRSAGELRVTFDATRYSSGVYFYRLTGPGHAAAKKMLLLR